MASSEDVGVYECKNYEMKLEKIVPFGRSFAEYEKMFMLSPDDLAKRIVGIGDGPASFNAEMYARGRHVVSIDPIYVHTAQQIESQFNEVVDNIIAQVRATPDDWVWSYHRSAEHLKENRVNALRQFLRDYESESARGRYVVGALPALNFTDGAFELALCSHFLFLYSDHLGYEFHRASLFEMLRVAAEVRIFPLLTLNSRMSSFVQPLLLELKSKQYAATVAKVDYEFQKGGNEMLCIRG